jgi:hypothetical protein
MKADAASRVAARKDVIWIRIKHAASAETTVITATVMVALKVNNMAPLPQLAVPADS